MRKRLLFHRDYRSFTGGHLKVLDYYRHAMTSERIEASIHVTPESFASHPWADMPGLMEAYDPEAADLLFVAGLDWTALDNYPGIELRKPVINLVQDFRHTRHGNILGTYLGRRALRICVSPEIADSLRATGLCNGPIRTIPAGLDAGLLPLGLDKTTSVFIGGLKAPRLAQELARILLGSGIDCDCLTEKIPRSSYLERLARARIAVLIPAAMEGFYLPAVEAMAMGVAVVCADATGNRGTCRHEETCLVAERQPHQLAEAVRRLLTELALGQMLAANGLAMARRHGIAQERAQFLEILDDYSGSTH